jgi:predicted DCC family thiol-disulfide oxidoreductase YuxK
MVRSTTPPGRDVVLFDGHCRICSKGARQLRGWSDAEIVSFRDQGVLERFPGVAYAACEKAMQFVRADGRVFEGAEAIVQAVRGRVAGKLAYAYYAPGLRQLADAAYRYVARRRFELSMRAGECDPDGACRLHLGEKR